jgi:hypothetical protein
MTAWAMGTAAVLALSAVPITARAQSDVFAVNYFDNITTVTSASSEADSTVRITNPGTNGAPSPSGDLCALIYVFRPDQQLAECCGCPVTPNGLRTISVRGDLTSNPLTADPLPAGVIKLVSSTGTVVTNIWGHQSLKCDAASPSPTPALIAWGTHVQDSRAITETAFERATLSTQELAVLSDLCGDIRDNGSGHGVCRCGVEPNDGSGH